LQITENAKKVLENRILRKDEEGNVIETPEEMLVRVARAIADNETEFDKFDWKEEFYDIMDNLYFLPNSPCLMNAGIPGGQLMACFVLPIEDNMESIMGTLRDAALIHKSGGGTGFSFSNIRPENDIVKTTGGIASGPVSFIRMYDAVTNEIKQGGKRRGANIAVLKCDHGDILKFIDCKRNNSQINNFNISVAVTDKFMKAVKANKDFELINPRNGEVTKTLPAKEIWDKLVEGAWQNGEPGIIFIDTVNEYNPLPELGEIVGTNPCGESVLLNNESCCLGSINLTKIVTSDKEINWDLLEKVARIATRFLDNILDVTEYPLPQIKEMSLGNRKIGLGVMGWGDMLFKLGIPYNSQKALDLAWKVMGVVDDEAFMASHVIAEEKGVFPNWHKSPSFQEKYGKVRNASRTCIAPTGTLSIIANCTSGIEPAYGLVYEKHVLDGQTLYEVNPVFEQELKNRGIYSKGLLQKIADNNGSCQGIKEIPEDMQEVFVVAHDISPEWHVKMQAAFQKQTGMGISKTCNLPHDATKKDVEDALMLAYESGCKGVTVYRDGSREEQVLTAGKKAKPRKAVKVEVRERPTETSGVTTALKTGCGKLYCTVNEDEEGVCEIFLNQKEGNGCRVAYNNALAMVSSMALRAGVPIKDISKVLKGQSCGKPVWDNGKLILSCPDAIGKLLSSEQHQEFKENLESLENPEKSVKPVKTCPLCGGQIISQGGCEICHDCGDSRCGG
jgi:ribonucleoside-diphosphate reductase alpha chain